MECHIRKGELLCLDGGQVGLKLICASGKVWVTTGDGVDYLIAGNGCFMVKRGEKALAEALEQCELSLSATGHTTRISHDSGVRPS